MNITDLHTIKGYSLSHFIKGVTAISSLIPLPIPDGWTVHTNRLAENVLEEHLLFLSNPYQKRIIDAGWYPEGQAEGEYCLFVMKMGEDGIHSIFYLGYDDYLLNYRTKDLRSLIHKITEILTDAP